MAWWAGGGGEQSVFNKDPTNHGWILFYYTWSGVSAPSCIIHASIYIYTNRFIFETNFSLLFWRSLIPGWMKGRVSEYMITTITSSIDGRINHSQTIQYFWVEISKPETSSSNFLFSFAKFTAVFSKHSSTGGSINGVKILLSRPNKRGCHNDPLESERYEPNKGKRMV